MACFEDEAPEEEAPKIPEYEGSFEKKERIKKALTGDICFAYDDEALVQDATDPCSSELIFTKVTNPGEYSMNDVSFYDKAAGVKVTSRWQTASTRKFAVSYPCKACAKGTDYDNRAIDRWKKGLPNSAYHQCHRGEGESAYWDICCIQNQILTEDMRGEGICGYNSTDPITFDWAWTNYKGGTPPHCPGRGGVTFIAKTRPRVLCKVTAKACVGTKNGIVCADGIGRSSKAFGDGAEAYGPLEGVIETAPASGPHTYNPQCLELSKQDADRPCTGLGFNSRGGCYPCPWYKSTKSCGFGFYECSAWARVGSAMPDIRCKHNGLSTSPNSSLSLKTLGDFADKSMFNAFDISWCQKAQPRNSALPCAPDPTVGAMGAYCLTLAGAMKSADWGAIIDSAYSLAKADAESKISGGCDGSPVATSLVSVELTFK